MLDGRVRSESTLPVPRRLTASAISPRQPRNRDGWFPHAATPKPLAVLAEGDGDPEAVFGLDAMLDDIMLYWLPNTGTASARLYWEARQESASTSRRSVVAIGRPGQTCARRRTRR